MFSAYPTYPQFRSLQLTSPVQKGEDVYALQTALNECGFDCGQIDGILGVKTATQIKKAQTAFGLIDDGKAGGLTQRALALEIAVAVASATLVPLDCFRGQLEFESSFRLGRYSTQREDGTYDAGVAQRNTKFTPPPSGFDAHSSIWELGKLIHQYWVLFEGIDDKTRRYALAQGAWNAPAFACFLAREEGAKNVTVRMTLQPSTAQRRTFEDYVANVSAYL